MTEHTPGPWRIGRGTSIVADAPAPGIGGSDEVEYYGGHLICESVNEPNARLIAAAPDLLLACQAAYDAMMQYDFGTLTLAPQLKAAIAKARGEATDA
jgi:hypothetical protein